MKSFVFVLCSILLLSAVIAEEETTIDIAEEPVIEYVNLLFFCFNFFPDGGLTQNNLNETTFSFILFRPKDSLAVEVSKQAAAASIKVLNDLLDGKQLEKSLYDR